VCTLCYGCKLKPGAPDGFRCPRCWGRGIVPAGFLPADVVLLVPPLGDAMRRTDVECAAGMLVATLALGPNEWQPVTWEQLQAAIVAHQVPERPAAGPGACLWHLLRNPFLRPDLHQLIALGYATRGPDMAISFTDAGLAALAKYVELPAAQGS